ncbi:MAG: response regulator [Anaeromyxobacter sp.]
MGRAPRILVVDDNEVLRTLVAQALEGEGYVAIAADSGEAALDVASFDPPDLCVVDQVMPGMSGAELIRALRSSQDERLRRIPAIGLTGYTGAERELIAAGACSAMPKPVCYGTLFERVRTVLGEQLH